jgi:NO-binding membrane sensor protein with MHYT domain
MRLSFVSAACPSHRHGGSRLPHIVRLRTHESSLVASPAASTMAHGHCSTHFSTMVAMRFPVPHLYTSFSSNPICTVSETLSRLQSCLSLL